MTVSAVLLDSIAFQQFSKSTLIETTVIAVLFSYAVVFEYQHCGLLQCHHSGMCLVALELWHRCCSISILAKFQILMLGSGQIVSNQNLLLATGQNSGTHNQNQNISLF